MARGGAPGPGRRRPPLPPSAETTGDPPGYPSGWESDVVLRDGGTVHVRPIRPSDGPGIRALHGRLSPETIYFRFLSPLPTLSPKLLERFVRVDYVDRMALVALLGGEIIAVGRYERLPSLAGPGDQAEVAFLVDDAHQGRGLGTVLLEQLAALARAAGITRFVADTLPDNSRMLRVFHEAGFDDQRTFADGVVRVAFDIQPTAASVAASQERERLATARSVRRLLAPRSVAVVGASRRPGTLGHELLRVLLAGAFEGPVYPVHPEAVHVCGVRAYPSVLDVPGKVDLAVVVVRAGLVGQVVEQCVRKHVGGLVVVSAGFADRDEAGREAERRIVEEARRNGMRLVGPSSMGILNTDPAVRLDASFTPMPPAGPVGFIAQSGALGVVVLHELARRGLGVSTFVSAGNKADVSGNDLLQYWDGDPSTSVIGMYIETFGNPRTFARVARRVSRRKPIVAVKSGRSTAGLAAAGRGAADRQADDLVDALFRRTGVIRTETLEELFDVAEVLVAQPLPPGRRVGIVGNSGGTGVLAADACAAAGLQVVELSPTTQQRLRAGLPGHGAVANPVDLPPDAGPEPFRAALEAVLADDAVDAAIVIYTSPLAASVGPVADAIRVAARNAPDRPVVACALGERRLLPGEPAIPSFAFPEAAARALGRAAEYAAWRRRPAGTLPPLPAETGRARALLARVLATDLPDHPTAGVALEPTDAFELLHAYGVPVAAEPPGGPPVALLTVRVAQDPLFGPLVTVAPAASRPAPTVAPPSTTLPLTDVDAAELRIHALGAEAPGPAADALEDLLLRVGHLADELPEVAELTLDPVVVTETGATAEGVAVRVAAVEPRPERALRRVR